ncbi:MAG TPA: type VII secretion target [Micromonospora sp.]
MSFKADPNGIREFGDTVGGLTDDAGSAVNYVHQWLNLGFAEGRIFFTVVQAANDARDALDKLYSRLGTITSASAEELRKAAKYYENTDHAAAERLDRTY